MAFLAVAGVLVIGGTRSALSSPPSVMRLDPATIKVDGGAGTLVTVNVVIEDVTDLGAFEFEIRFDTDFMKLVDIRVGPFLGSMGRDVTCQQKTIDQGIERLGCNTPNPEPPGPEGSGVVASLDFSVQGHSAGETILRLSSCDAADVLGNSILSDACKDSKVTINLPTATPPGNPRMRKLPALQNLFLTRQSDKIPPATCLDSSDTAELAEKLSIAIPEQPDPKDPSQNQQLGAFEFEVHFDDTKVCVELQPGSAAAGMTCIIEDATTFVPQGVARIGCVSTGKDTFPDTSTPGGRHLADIIVRPQPDVYSQVKPEQENGVVVQLLNQGCELADLQGHPIPIFSCEDADVTFRYLEGDVEPDCLVNGLDAQGIAFRWGAEKGALLYLDRYNLEPSAPQADDDIDIKDLQFVYGRFGSDCQNPHPPQPPVNPKGEPTPTPQPTATSTPTPESPKPRINKSPNLQELLLSSPPESGECQDSQDAVSVEVMIKDPITSIDAKDSSQLQQLGAFEFETQFDPSWVCIEISPGEIPEGEMSCFTVEGADYVHFGCTTLSSETPPAPQPPGVLAVITVWPQPGAYAFVGPGEQSTTELVNKDCQLSDLLGHPIKSSDCDGATIIIRYP